MPGHDALTTCSDMSDTLVSQPNKAYSFSFVLYTMTFELQCTFTKQGLQCEWGLSVDEDVPCELTVQQVLRHCRLAF